MYMYYDVIGKGISTGFLFRSHYSSVVIDKNILIKKIHSYTHHGCMLLSLWQKSMDIRKVLLF